MKLKIKNIVFQNEKLLSIDLLRFFASFSVFYYHYGIYNFLNKFHLNFLDFVTPFGSTYAVPLFFIISGFCIHWSNRFSLKEYKTLPLKEYYRRRFFRIYPPYVFALFISIGVNFLLGKGIGMYDFLMKLFLLHSYVPQYFSTVNFVLWTIAIEVFFYLVYPFFYFCRVRIGLLNTLNIVFVISMCSIFTLDYFNVSCMPGRWLFLNFLFIWCCGAALADVIILESKSFVLTNKLLLNVVFFIFIYLLLFLLLLNKFYFFDQLHCLLCIFILIFFLCIQNHLTKYGNIFVVFVFFSGAGYSIYLLHEPLILLKNVLFEKFNLSGNVFAHMMAFPIIFYLCYLSYKFVEIPFINLGKRK